MSLAHQTQHWRGYPAMKRPDQGWVEGWRRHVLWVCANYLAHRQLQQDYENAAAAGACDGAPSGSALLAGVQSRSPRPRTDQAPTIAAAAQGGAPRPRPRNKRRKRARR